MKRREVETFRKMSFAFALVVPLLFDDFVTQLYEFRRVFHKLLDAAEHGPDAEELGRWADDGGYVPEG